MGGDRNPSGRIGAAFGPLAMVAAMVAPAVAPPAGAATVPSFAAGSATVVEGDSGTRVAYLPVTLTDQATAQVTVAYAVTAASASAGVDFKAKSGTLVFKPGTASGLTPVRKLVAVMLYADTTAESTETFTLTLSNPTGAAAITQPTGVGTILDDDPSSGLRVAAGDTGIWEGDTGPTRAAKPTVTLSAPATAPVTVQYALTAGTATAGTDVKVKTGTLAFNVGQYKKTVAAIVYPDATDEADETATLTLTGATGATITRSTGTLTIHDDDGAPPAPGSTAWAWGYNGAGQVGDGTLTQRESPTQVGTDTTWATVSAGSNHTCGTRTDGTLWCWGDNAVGQVGDGTMTNRPSPTQVGTDTTWASVGSGALHTCGTRTDGTLWCWGDNFYGQLGDGTSTTRPSPTQVGTDTTWATVGAGYFHTCATRTDGTLWCWGANGVGQLGDGSLTDRPIPTQVGTDTTWATVDGGGFLDGHTCATRTDGTLWCWGANGMGQLGDGSLTDRPSPTQVGTDTTWATVSAGGHTCGTRTDGTLWCWGFNGVGQLGDGSLISRPSPTQVGTDTTWATVSAAGFGTGHTCATRTGGTLWCWGDNAVGELGDGTTTLRPSPTQVGTDTTWFAVGTGDSHTVALRT